jgi:hypothetical protein
MRKVIYIRTWYQGPDENWEAPLSTFILHAYLIPPKIGLLPPMNVLNERLKRGGGNGGMSPGCVWEPFELDEQEYWEVAHALTSLRPDEVADLNDDLAVGEIGVDYKSSCVETYSEWLEDVCKRYAHLLS